MATKQANPPEARVSFGLGDFVAGGILPEGDYDFSNSRFENWDYDGKAAKPTLAFASTLTPAEGGDPIDQRWSVGNPEHFQPTEDGKGVVPVGTKTGLSKSSNFFLFMENLVNAGFPEDKLGNDASVFDGLRAHVVQIPQPKRNMPTSNLVQGEQHQERERTLPVVTAIIKLPWEKLPAAGAKTAAKPAAAPAGKGAAAAKPAATPAPAPEATVEISEAMLTAMSGVLDGQQSIERTQFRIKTFQALTKAVGAKQAQAEAKIFNNDEQLSAALAGVGYAIADKNIVLAG